MKRSFGLSFPAKADYLLLARLALGGVVRDLSVGPELLADLRLAVTEACGNAVRHAYSDGGDGMVEVAFVVNEDRLEMIVADSGAGLALPVVERLLEAEPEPTPSWTGGWVSPSSVRSSTSSRSKAERAVAGLSCA